MKRSAQKATAAATKLSRGNIGSVVSRSNYVNKKLDKFANKEARATSRATSKASRSSSHAKLDKEIQALRGLKKGRE